MLNKPLFLTANWSAPKKVKTLITTRIGGYSSGGYTSLNLALHVDDDINSVTQNRQLLTNYLPEKPLWLNQVHSNHILDADNPVNNIDPDYDAIISRTANKVCVVMTADCLPILLTDQSGSYVAAVHSGWRGLENGIINKIIKLTRVIPEQILAYIGPAICQKHYEVGQDVYDVFTSLNPANTEFFSRQTNGKFHCNLTGIAKLQLLNAGLLPEHISFSNECTYCNNELFYSYRKERNTGRFASLIWLE